MAKSKVKRVNVTNERISETAKGLIFDTLTGEREFDKKTGLAMKFLNFQSREKQMEHGEKRFRFSMVKVLADPEVTRRYVASTEPQIKKMLSA